MIKTIPKEKKTKTAKWLSKEALQIAQKRREMKDKGEKERYIHLNSESQRIARRDKKAFLSDQCKKIEENKRMTEISSRKLEIPREYFMHRVFSLSVFPASILAQPFRVALDGLYLASLSHCFPPHYPVKLRGSRVF